MKSKHKLLHSVWNEMQPLISDKKPSVRNIDFDEFIGSFFCPGPFCYYIFDFTNRCYTFIHPNLKEIFGADPENFTVDDLISLVHPDDIPHMAQGERIAFEFIIGHLPVEKRLKYKISYCIRMKTANGLYKLFMQQAVALTLDEAGNLGEVFGVYADISHITTFNNYRASFTGLDGEPSYLNIDPAQKADTIQATRGIFTKQEIQVIKLLAEGFSCKEIGEELSLSAHTISTHRKKALVKSGCSNTTELVAQCIRQGLI